MLNRSTLTIALLLSAASVAAQTAAMQRRATPPDLTMGRDWDEGGAVGCSNGRGMSERARIIARNIGRGDDCDDEPQPPRFSPDSRWITEQETGQYSGVWAEEDSTFVFQHRCFVQGNARSDRFALGRGDMRYGTDSLSPDGRQFLDEIGTSVRSARLTIFVPNEQPRILHMARRITADADWGFNISPNPATMDAIRRASHYQIRVGSRTLTFSGVGSTRAIARTECQQVYD